MSTKIINRRQQLIINRLKTLPSSFSELQYYVFSTSALDGTEIELTLRTLQRDIKTIDQLYGIEIKFDKSLGKYLIVEEYGSTNQKQLLDHISLVNLLEINETAKYLHFQHKQPRGIEYFSIIVKSMREKKLLKITHKKHWDAITHYEVLPLALKEYKGIWYLVGQKITGSIRKMRTFGMDRIIQIDIGQKVFNFPEDFDCDAYFHHAFGIVRPENEKPQTIVLKFKRSQAGYIKNKPFHHTQKIIDEDADGITISIEVYLTFELKQELLGLNNLVEILHPKDIFKQTI